MSDPSGGSEQAQAQPSAPASRTRPWPVHTLLFAAYAVLFLFAVNLANVAVGEVAPPLIPWMEGGVEAGRSVRGPVAGSRRWAATEGAPDGLYDFRAIAQNSRRCINRKRK